MKKILIFSALILIATTAHGQIDFGVKGGMNFSSVPKESITLENDFDHTIETLDDNYTGFHIGFFSQINLPFIFVNPELIYTSIGNDMRRAVDNGEDQDDYIYYERNIRRIDVPVLAGTTLGPVRIGVGPVGSILVGESSILDDDYPGRDEIEEDINTMTFGYQVGVGVNISNLVLDFKYEGALTKMGDGVTVGGETRQFDSRPSQFIISIGVIL